MRQVLDVKLVLQPDTYAQTIGGLFDKYQQLRQEWLREIKEIRDYVFATDTRTTSNNKVHWSNSTVIPKLTQLMDNLTANYSATLFPQDKWLSWKAADVNSASSEKINTIESYMYTKLRGGGFINETGKFLMDYILTGNTFAQAAYVRDTFIDEDGLEQVSYAGPRAFRIDPFDIVFDPTATSFKETPKIVRALYTLGSFKKKFVNDPAADQGIVEKVLANRRTFAGYNRFRNADGFIADGFGDIQSYYSSGQVEVLTFYGDLYDVTTGESIENRVISVVDRCYVLVDQALPDWTGYAPIFQATWRDRPGNLYGMSPLANLIGMQYRVNHLENLRADVFDQLSLPMLTIQGEVQDFSNEPGAKVYLGENGRVAYLQVQPEALTATNDIFNYLGLMEEMAGAPREAMGFRTPGEKTAFEVQTLTQFSARIFQHKASQFEASFLEPMLNCMLGLARREMDDVDVTLVYSDSTQSEIFRTISRLDIQGRGQLRPVGARHFAERALRVQNINNVVQLKLADPSIGAHISGKEIARILSSELREPGIFGEFIGQTEQRENATDMADQEAQLTQDLLGRAEAGV